MEFLIRENLTLAAPDIRPVVTEAAAQANKRKRMIVEIAAIHEGITKNYNKYTSEELEKATTSWMAPYPKPLILNHDLNSEPIGRMVNSEYKKGLEGEGYIQLRVAVLDAEAASKVMDGRYLTGSVGGMPTAAICSICHQDVIAASREGDRCGHNRGDIYGEQVCVYEHRGISFHEYSFVNAPGDSKSQIQGHVTESDANLSVYSVDFENASVEKFTESDGFINVREMMSEVDANKLYLDVAFGSQYAQEQYAIENAKNMMFDKNVSTIATESGSSDLEHNQMTDKNATEEIVEQEQEDILDVTDRLSSDLSEESDQAADEQEQPAPEAEVKEEEEAPEADAKLEEADEEKDGGAEAVETEEKVEDAKESEEPVATAESEETPEAEESKEAEATEDKDLDVEEKAEGQEEAKAEEPESAPGEEAAPEASEEVTESETVSSEEEAPAETEDGASVAELQARIDSLEEENAKLKEQNDRMKAAIHAELAEKVVDARIAVGHLTEADREEALTEHKTRSAASLADALVDIRSFAEKNNFQVQVVNGTVPSLEIQAVAVVEESDAERAPIEGESEVEEVQESVDPHELVVEELSALLSKGQEKYLTRNR